MNFDVAHISDIHFGNSQAVFSRDDVCLALKSIIKKLSAETIFLIISGDITFKGKAEGYTDAARAIEESIRDTRVNRKNILTCPGNHDITSDARRGCFELFDEWSTRLRNDKRCTFNNTSAQIISTAEAHFLIINTAYRQDRTFGAVEIDPIKDLLEKLPVEKIRIPRIAVIHHNLIPISLNDNSTTRNAFELIKILDEHGFSAILHGHQHAVMDVLFGRSKIILSGVGSLAFDTKGFINSAAVYRYRDSVCIETERFGLTLDAPSRIVQFAQ